MTYQKITKNGVDTATPLAFDEPARSEKQANITIEAGPLGLVVKVEYTGPIGGIPAAIERLRAAGVLDLVQTSKPAAPAQPGGNTPARKAAQPRETPTYNGAGEPCCSVHTGRVLKVGQYGLYCSAKDRETGEYCKLKFKD